MEIVNSGEKVSFLFRKWVDEEGSEGLVVRTELPVTYKIKPRHNIDVVVVGFSEGTGIEAGQARSLLTAMIPENGKYQIIGRVGSGLYETLRKDMYKKFIKKTLKSDFIETDTNYVAFRMVEPEMVIEVSVNDLLFDTVSGPKQNAVLYIENGEFKLHSYVDGFKFLAPVFERVRDDKKADADDVRISQVEDLWNRETETVPKKPENTESPKSKLLIREVYKKTSGTKTMVQKYMIWKTNKDNRIDYPAYVLHITNFSTDRKEPLQREVRISDSRRQIFELMEKLLETNIKKGWYMVSSDKYPEKEIQEKSSSKQKNKKKVVIKT